MTDSFSQKLIEVTVKLASDSKTNQPTTFSESGTDTVTLSGSRTSVRIANSGTPVGSTAHIAVYGMTPSLMNQLATLGVVFNIVTRNQLTVTAGDAVNGLATVFSGTIVSAYGDYNSSPDVPFRFECNSGLADAVAPAAVSSFTGPTDVATIMSGFARQMNLGFENNGITAQLSNPYFSGNTYTQMLAAADHANIKAEIVNGNVLAIWPKGGSRTGGTVPLISKDTGMVGYPSFTQNGIIFKTLFNPVIAFGGLVQIQSLVFSAATQSKSANSQSVLPADGNWAVYKLDHALDSQVPRGQWISTVYAYNPKYPRPVSPGIQPS